MKAEGKGNFDMTLEECRKVFDTIENLVIVDGEGAIKYLSPDMYKIIEVIEGRAVPLDVVGEHILKIHPTSKLCSVLDEGTEDRDFFYFTVGVTNVARIKPIREGKKMIGAIDYDLFSDDLALKSFLNKIVDYSIQGFLNLRETVDTIFEIGNRLDAVKYCVSDIIGESVQMVELRKKIHQISESESTVMIIGPTGCGKELVAHSIHNSSRRRSRGMIEINCAAIPDNLVESELFGYEDGTFTGAKRGGRMGRFEMADKGTIFLDEIDQLPYHIQPKLLRVLQEKEITRIGGKTVPVNIRVIAATNKNLKEMVAQGKFREDLYYRLNVVEVRVAPLGERRCDIPLLVEHQITRLNKIMCKRVMGISAEALDILKGYDWPGNIRELFNILERAMNVCREDLLQPHHFGDFLTEAIYKKIPDRIENMENLLDVVRDRAEKDAIERILQIAGGNKSKAAKMLNISRTNLYYKMERYGIK